MWLEDMPYSIGISSCGGVNDDKNLGVASTTDLYNHGSTIWDVIRCTNKEADL